MTLKTFGGITVECERPMVNHKVREFVMAFKYANRVIGEIFIKNDDYATFESAYQTLWLLRSQSTMNCTYPDVMIISSSSMET